MLDEAEVSVLDCVLIEPMVLRDDHAMLGGEKTQRIVDAFRREGPEKVEQLAASVALGDWESTAAAAHALKSAAGQLGLKALEAAARVLEAAASQHDEQRVLDGQRELPDLFNRSLAVLEDLWSSLQEVDGTAMDQASAAAKR